MPAAPFDTKRLDALMDNAGMDVLLATSKHNVQYLLGGHRAFFFDYMDAVGIAHPPSARLLWLLNRGRVFG